VLSCANLGQIEIFIIQNYDLPHGNLELKFDFLGPICVMPQGKQCLIKEG
jgi:hypothetical protein